MAKSLTSGASTDAAQPRQERDDEARVSVRIDAALHHALKMHLLAKRVSMKDWLVGAIEKELGR